ncbi:MAG: helix-hairpin-helix domain-containing protein [Geminicoccaceae bacterium]
MPELIAIKGVGPVLAKACAENGYDRVEQIAAAMLHDLIAVPGINEAKAKLVIAAAQDLLQKEPASNGQAMPSEVTPAEAAAEAIAAPSKNAKNKKQKAKKMKDNKKKDKKKKKKPKKKKSKKGKKS